MAASLALSHPAQYPQSSYGVLTPASRESAISCGRRKNRRRLIVFDVSLYHMLKCRCHIIGVERALVWEGIKRRGARRLDPWVGQVMDVVIDHSWCLRLRRTNIVSCYSSTKKTNKNDESEGQERGGGGHEDRRDEAKCAPRFWI